jgi:hypothetical protein
MAQAKTKPATTKAAPAKAAPAKAKAAPAKKAAEAAAKPAKPVAVLAVGAFVKFLGYRANVTKDEAIFKADEILYLIEVGTADDKSVVYSAIKAADLGEYQDSGLDNITGGEVTPQEVAELKGTALEKATEQFTPVAIIGKLEDLLAEAEGDAIQVAVELNREIQAAYFWMGGALAKILQEGTYLKANGGQFDGEDAFNEFTNAEFAFSGSKGRALARIYTTFSKIEGFDPDRLASVDWSKVSIAEKYVTPENVDTVLEIAESSTQRELAVTLKEKFASGNTTPSGKTASRSSIQKVTLAFKFEEDAAETVKLVIKQAMTQIGTESESLALERIMLEWAEDHVDGDTAKKRIQSKAAKVQKVRDAQAAEDAAEKARKDALAAAKATADAKKPAPKAPAKPTSKVAPKPAPKKK